MSVTFRVDDVETERTAPPTKTLRDHYGPDTLAFGGEPTRRILQASSSQSLLGAIHHAFAEHRPLALTPDAVWLTIAQGVARHVQLNPAALRDRLGGRHTGRARIEIEVQSFDPTRSSDLVASFQAELAARGQHPRSHALRRPG